MSKKKWFVVAAVVWVLLANLPTGPRAIDASPTDYVSGTATNGCIRSDAVVFSASTVGYSQFQPQFHLHLEGPFVVTARWEGSNGAVWNGKSWYAGDGETVEVYAYSQNGTLFYSVNGSSLPYPGELHPTFAPGSSMTAKLVFRVTNAPYYTGCYRVTNVVVWRIPSGSGGGGVPPATGGGGFSPSPSPTPTPTGAPTPTPAPTVPSCASEVPFPEDCDPPPGYCWGYGPPTPGEPWPMIECEVPPTPSPSPTPAPTCNVWEGYSVDDGESVKAGFHLKLCSYSGSAADGAVFGPGTALPALPHVEAGGGGAKVLYFRQVSLGSGGCANPGYWFSVFDKNSAGTYAAGGSAFCNNFPWVGQLAGSQADGDVFSVKGKCGFGACSGGTSSSGGDGVAGGFTFYWYPQLTGSQQPWNLSPGADPTPTPGPSPTPSPSGSALPSGFIESAPPVPPGDGGTGGFDVCDPQYVEANGAALCASNPAYSFQPGVADPAGFDGVMLHLQSKAPFGYVSQVVTAIEDASENAAGGAGPGGGSYGCFTLPWWSPEGTQSQQACIPLQDFADDAAPFRTVMLAMFLVLVGVGILRWVLKSSGGGGD